METVRAFIGCVLDLGATRKVQELSRATRALADPAGWEVRWVPPPSLHHLHRCAMNRQQPLQAAHHEGGAEHPLELCGATALPGGWRH